MALRSPLTVQPYDYIADSNGRPLDYGQVYIGVANQDPEFYQIPVYLDAAMTKPVDQPIRTNDGFVDFAGSLSELYASAEVYSVKVLDKQGRKVLYKGDMTRKNLMSDALADLNQSIIDTQTAAQITLNAAVNSANTEVAQTVSLATAAIDTATTKSNKAATDADAAITQMFENGGLPATPFATKALMTASVLVDGKYAMVTDDTVNNGLYVKEAGAWVKSSYDVKTMALNAAYDSNDKVLTEFFTYPINLFTLDNVIRGQIVGVSGELETNSNYFGVTDFIAVDGDAEYTIRTTTKYAVSSAAYYDRDRKFIKRVYPVIIDETEPEYVFSLTTPINTAYVRFSVFRADHSSKVMFYKGSEEAVSGYIESHKPILKKDLMLSNNNLERLKLDLLPYGFEEKNVIPPKSLISNKSFVNDGSISVSGEPIEFSGYAYTKPIAIKSDTSYVFQTKGSRLALRYVAWYTENHDFIVREWAQAPTPDDNFLIARSPLNARYAVVFSETRYLDNEINNVAMYDGESVDVNFDITNTKAKIINTDLDISDEFNRLLDIHPDSQKLNNSLEDSYNLFNPATAEASTVISGTGELTPNGSYFTSDYIPVSEGVYTILGTRLSTTPFSYIGYYTKDRVFISRGAPSYATNGTDGSRRLLITIPDEVAFVRLSGNLGSAYDRERMLIEGEVAEDTPYDTGETKLTKVKLAQDVRFDARTPRFRTDTDISGTFHTNIVAHEAERPYTETSFNSAQVYERYDALAALYPDNIETFELGVDELGNRMAYYKVTAPKIHEDTGYKTPLVFINCGIHGSERISTTVMYRVIEQMLTDWRSSDVLQSLKFNMDLLVLPVSNPSGWNTRSRVNHNGVDINRNFSTGWGTQHNNSGESAFSEPESRAVAKVITDNAGIDIFWDFHNFSGTVQNNYYTWLPITSRCYPYMKAMANSYVSKLAHLIQRDYDYVPESWVAGLVNESLITGMAQDYAAEMGIPFSCTFELGSYLYPYAEHIGELPNDVAHDEVHSKVMYEATVTALITFLEELQRY